MGRICAFQLALGVKDPGGPQWGLAIGVFGPERPGEGGVEVGRPNDSSGTGVRDDGPGPLVGVGKVQWDLGVVEPEVPVGSDWTKSPGGGWGWSVPEFSGVTDYGRQDLGSPMGTGTDQTWEPGGGGVGQTQDPLGLCEWVLSPSHNEALHAPGILTPDTTSSSPDRPSPLLSFGHGVKCRG